MTYSSGDPVLPPSSASLDDVGPEAQLRQLINKAFDVARQGGRTDWRQMSIAVLKNRLLTLTDRTFNEADYGQRTFTDLVRQLPDLLIIDESTRPPTVRLLPEEAPQQVKHIPAIAARIRPDLWNAIIDYRSGRRYLWNGQTALPEDEDSSSDEHRYPYLPTLSEADMEQWRSQFVAHNTPLVAHDPALVARLERWRDNRLRTAELPGILRGRWNAQLKELVAQRILDWFDAQSVTPPRDVLQATGPGAEHKPAASATDALRDLVLRCVRAMTDAELRELRLPPAAVLRARL